MTKSLDDLPKDIYSVLEGKSIFDESVADRFADSLKDILLKRLKQEERTPVLRMSNLGKKNRQLYYELNNYPGEKLTGSTLVKFAYGDLCESLIIALSEAAGHEVSRFQEEVEIDGVRGHIDLVLSGVLVDVKSCSPYSFDKFKDGSLLQDGMDPFGYRQQLQSYAKLLHLPAAWVAINKVSGELCVLHLPEEDFDLQGRIQEVRNIVSKPEPPERCYEDEPEGASGNRKLSVSCSYCSYKFLCWDGLRIFAYSNGPKFLTHVEKLPKVFEITNKTNKEGE